MISAGSEAKTFAHSVGSRLADLLRPTPESVLVVDRSQDGTMGPDLAGFFSPGGPTRRYDAVLVDGAAVTLDAGLVARLHGALVATGRLVVSVPVGGVVGHLAPAREARLRDVVAILSEGGFAVLRVRQIEGLRGPAGAVVARPDAFVVRPATAGEGAAIVDLFHRCFHPERDLAGWRWRYRMAPAGEGPISVAVDADAHLAAHYAGYPVHLRVGAQTRLALHMGDTMTAPNYRDLGRGGSTLLARTVRHFFARHRDGRFALYYGFNTGPIQRFCQWFIGGSRLAEVCFRRCRLENVRWSPSGARVVEPSRFGRRFDSFFERAAPAYGILIERNGAYLDWRYRRSPEARYLTLAAFRFGRLVGWSVFRREARTMVWGDALFLPRHAGISEAVLARALADPSMAGVSEVVGWFPPRPPWWHRQLEDLGFQTEPEPQALGLVYLAEEEALGQRYARELYYTKGDGDLF